MISWRPTGLLSQIKKELLSALRDPRSRMVVIGPPIMQLILFAFAVTLSVNHASVGLWVKDPGPAGRALSEALAHSGFVHRVVPLYSEAQLAAAIERQDVLLALVAPEDLSARISTGRPAQIQLIADGRRGNAAQVATSYISQILAGLPARLTPAAPQAAQPSVRHWFNPNLNYRWYVVPSLSGILSLIISFILAALSIARERELGTFDQLLVSPAAGWEIIAAKLAAPMIIAAFLANLMIAAGVFVFQIPFYGSLPLLELSLFVFSLSVASLGLLLSALCRTQQQAVLGSFIIILPLVLLSGFATPIENMPAAFQWVAYLTPLSHYLQVVQGSFVKALPASVVLSHVAVMAAIAVPCLLLASFTVRRRLG